MHGLPARLLLDRPRVFGDEEAPKEPIHRRGIVAGEPGLYFVGLLFLYAMSSGFLPGVGRDAEHVAKHIASRHRNGYPSGRFLAGSR